MPFNEVRRIKNQIM